MTKQRQRGGQPGNQNATKPPEQKRIRCQWSAYAEDLARMKALIEAGYGQGPTEVIRRLLKEAVERMEQLK